MHPEVVRWFADALVQIADRLGADVPPLTDSWVDDCQRLNDIQTEELEKQRRKLNGS